MSDIFVPQDTYAGLENFVEIIEPRGGTVESGQHPDMVIPRSDSLHLISSIHTYLARDPTHLKK